ncbi:peptide-methionine (S)-S-oxide reductase MsrA [Salinisphaera orenii]|uniref:Peptide methionine sulfoxide reductase MsrA n=1 Tax=Salinisphaera orenii YIM 95161 TaxID=1051139 RepID=A0A423Q0F8_9GAMM|nr:peptide-methionine (S)-S-oxide reductase MsrA [Salinisphaera halophila]ROO31728.1 MsrA3 - peptide methionine sulfoxide reductase [Salinisphaera halophila YIM 95161]
MKQNTTNTPRRHTVAGRCLLATLLLCVGLTAAAAGDSPAERPFEPDVADDRAVAIFAGGCFWCVEEAFDKVDGVVSTTSGYTGGHVDDPSYEQVSQENTGHAEALKVVYRPETVDYDSLLETFWHNIDPTDDGGQFCDRGDSYRSEIFVVDDAQRKAAEASKRALQNDPDAPSPIVTEITAATTFYPAEAYHQNYHEKNPLRYKFYKASCRREAVLEERWGETGSHD